MTHLFINALAASAGGGLTYIRNVVPQLAAQPDVRITVALGEQFGGELGVSGNIEVVAEKIPAGRRFWYEQSKLGELIRFRGADVLLSAGNFALRKSPVPQILLSRNSIYTSSDFYRDLRLRHEYRLWLETRMRATLARKSVHWADSTVAPSEAFAAELRRWSGSPVRAIHHGFDRQTFVADSSPLAAEIEKKLVAAEGSLKLLFVSHYNYYRNFETLFRALPILQQRLAGRSVRLLLTCKLRAGENPGPYDPRAAAELVKALHLEEMVVELGTIPYRQLHHIYRRANVYVTPAYTETFAHPLVEAMSSGLPVVASDLAVHREICGDAACYFARFSPEELAERVAEVASSREMAEQQSASGQERSREFSWKKHVEELLGLVRWLMGTRCSTAV